MNSVSAWGRAVIAGILLLSAGMVQAQTPVQSPEAPEGPYRISPGDVLSITVLEDPELDRQVLVAPDGRIAMPLAGSLTAEGLTPVELEDTLRAELRSSFVEPPNITVSLVSISEDVDDGELPREVYVIGEVSSPGRYLYDPETEINVLQALSLAGGPGPFAAIARIQVREQLDGIETIRFFDYEAVEDGLLNSNRDLSVLSDGAIIIVPERGLFE